jgi:hypothetical protein
MEEFFKFLPAGAADFSRKEPIPPAPSTLDELNDKIRREGS